MALKLYNISHVSILLMARLSKREIGVGIHDSLHWQKAVTCA